MSTPSPTTTTTCTRHADRETGLRCQRCERPWCFACLTPAPVGSQCVECVRAAAPPSALRRLKPADFLPHSAVAALAALCLGGFLTQVVTPNNGITMDEVELRLAYSSVLVWAGDTYRLVTALFLHGDLLHLLVSLLGLWLLGTRIEQRDGAVPALLIFLGAGIAGGAATYLLAPPSAFAIGASAALFGFAGVLVARSADTTELKDAFVSLAILTVAVVLVVPSVSTYGHAGGLVAGLLFGAYDRVTGDAANKPLSAAIVLLAIAATTVAIVQTNAPGPG